MAVLCEEQRRVLLPGSVYDLFDILEHRKDDSPEIFLKVDEQYARFSLFWHPVVGVESLNGFLYIH